jgi:E3 ubiquitin-protein ligase SHPRH
MIAELLNAQTNLLWQWRDRLIEVLTRGIGSDSGEDADGGEYARSLETQREAETFLDAYSVLLNDRREALFAEKSLLAAHDGRGRFKRATAAAIKALGLEEVDPDESPPPEAANDLYRAWPEDGDLRQDLMEQRLILLDPFQGRALKSIMVELSNFDSDRDKRLKSLATEAASSLRDLIASQSTTSRFIEPTVDCVLNRFPSETPRET